MPQGAFNPARTAWHITVGCYMSRLHGGDLPTVDRQHNQRGEPFIERDPQRETRERDRATGEPVRLSQPQREFIEATLPEICERGGWTYHIAASPPPPENDHFHILLDAGSKVHGKEIRRWLKRWLTIALDKIFEKPEAGEWWVDGGSTKPVKEPRYFANCFNYIRKQRTTLFETHETK